MKLKCGIFLIILVAAGRLTSVSTEIKAFNGRLRRLSAETLTAEFSKDKPRAPQSNLKVSTTPTKGDKSDSEASVVNDQRTITQELANKAVALKSRADSKSNRKLTSEQGLSIMHLVVGCLLTAIMFAVLGVCTKESISSRSSDECGVFGWLGGGIFAALGLKYILNSSKSLMKSKRLRKRSLKMMTSEDLNSISKGLYDKQQVEKILSPTSFSKVFKTTMRWVKDQDLKELDPSDSKGVFKFIRRLLYSKFPNSKKMLGKSIREVQRLSGYFKK